MLEAIESTWNSLKRMNKRQALIQFFNFLSVMTTAFMLWKSIAWYTNCESPIVVVLSESMYPAFDRGDILILSMKNTPILAGDICVFKISGREIPIVHRAIKVHHECKADGKTYILTKGDNNNVHDRSLYAENQEWLVLSDLIGRVDGYFPFMGMITIVMTDFPKVKYAILAVLGLFVLVSRE